jgi:hypothetical protein
MSRRYELRTIDKSLVSGQHEEIVPIDSIDARVYRY